MPGRVWDCPYSVTTAHSLGGRTALSEAILSTGPYRVLY